MAGVIDVKQKIRIRPQSRGGGNLSGSKRPTEAIMKRNHHYGERYDQASECLDVKGLAEADFAFSSF
jgi:hypothetical protein